MSSILALALSYVLLYKYLALFIMIFGAALVLPIPSNVVMIAVGVFCNQGYMDPVASFAVIFLANVLGDLTGYFLTRHYGQSLWQKLIRRQPAYFINLERYIKTSAGWTIILTRFINTVGFAVNLLCGLVKLPFRRFLGWDIVGNILGVSSMMIIGFVFSKYWGQAADFANLFSLGLMFILIISVVIKITSWNRHQPPEMAVK